MYEALSQLGGKARSFGATGTGKDGREDLPAEHGFRVFAGEYGATRDVMKNIPFNRYSRTNVEQNLVEGRRAIMASKDSPAQFIVPSSFPRSADDFKVWVDYFETVDKYLQPDERDFFLKRIAIVKSFCIERRFAEFENVTWWEYMHADRFSPEYQNLVQMISGTILAANPRNANAHIVGTLAADIIDRTLVPGDRGILIMLDGPTSDMWIEPWVQHLRSLGVVFQLNTTLTSFEMSPDGSRVTAAAVEYNGKRQSVVADVFFSAVPAEKMARVLSQSPDVLLAAPSLRQVDQLMTAWMVGAQFYLSEDIQITNGHIGFLQNPWALAAVSQTQFRPHLNLSNMGDGTVKGVLSVTISNWTTPGLYVCTKPAMECSKDDVLAEVWQQLVHWLDHSLNDTLLNAQYIDPGVQWSSSAPPTNWSPLLINTVKSWWQRPEAFTEIPNFYIAADYARAPQNVACMETAVQAARIAVNKLIERGGYSNMSQAPLFDWEKTNKGEGALKAIFGPLRLDDELRFKEGKPNEFCKSPACMDQVEDDKLSAVVEDVIRLAQRVAAEQKRSLHL